MELNIEKGTPFKGTRGAFIPLMRVNKERLKTAIDEARKFVEKGLGYDEVLKKADSRILYIEDIEKLFEEYKQKNVNSTDETSGKNKSTTMFTHKQLEVEEDEFQEIEIDKIRPNPNQARKKFDEDKMGELADSIKQHGLLQPITITKKDDYYEIIAGERRWRACKLLNYSKIKCIVKEVKSEESAEYMSLIENIQREDLTLFEKAVCINGLIEKFNLTQEEIAIKIGKAKGTVCNILRILDLDDRVIEFVKEGKLTHKHCKILLSIKDPEEQYKKALEIINNNISSNKLEKEQKKIEENEELPQIYNETKENLQKIIGENLKFKAKPKTKTILLSFKTDEDLQKFVNLFKKMEN